MPLITAHILKGRGPEIKRRLASALTEAISDILDVQPKSVHVLIEEYDRENWAIGGELFSDQQSAAKNSEVDLDALFRKPPPPSVADKPAAKAKPRKAPAKSRQRR